MVRDQAQTILDFESRMERRIKGQSHALAGRRHGPAGGQGRHRQPRRRRWACSSSLGRAVSARRKPRLGIADLLFGGERFMKAINMSEFQEKHTVSLLKGSPPGYIGFGEGGVLTEAVRQRPYTVVLLDEIEKAHRM